jgi:hypothetical protein
MKKLNLQSYKIEHYRNEKGQWVEERHNKGFYPMTLLGILERVQMEIVNQLEGQTMQPDIKRVYVGKQRVDNKKLDAK